jgi:ribosomal protein S24E
MKFNIVVEKDNPLFKRKEIEGTIHTKVAPSKVEVAKELATRYSVSEENIVVDTIEGRFGAQEFILVAQIYESKEAKDATETKTKKQREAEAKIVEDSKKAEEESKAAEEMSGDQPTESAEAPQEENTVEAPAGEKKSE